MNQKRGITNAGVDAKYNKGRMDLILSLLSLLLKTPCTQQA